MHVVHCGCSAGVMLRPLPAVWSWWWRFTPELWHCKLNRCLMHSKSKLRSVESKAAINLSRQYIVMCCEFIICKLGFSHIYLHVHFCLTMLLSNHELIRLFVFTWKFTRSEILHLSHWSPMMIKKVTHVPKLYRAIANEQKLRVFWPQQANTTSWYVALLCTWAQ